ncbi:histidinol-phosphatase [bacterium BMS3Abin03]|jgi:histidinol phosphatase-like enzyme (inositol monophosphatase family)|nr:histidinol-phosphatase [bacterium BMS3Abin03]MCG6960230.1 histidinol-phosphatase [bacterium BMS3Abin03]
MKEHDEFRKFARYLADLSAGVIKPYFRTNIRVEQKSDQSPVTIADKNAEEIMRNEIEKEFPEHGIIGEEFGNHKEEAEYKWVLDPIDGTKSFICGIATFGTLISLLKDGEPVLGIINQPIINEFLYGDGNTTELNGITVKARSCNKLSDAVLLTSDHLMIEKYQDKDKFDSLIKKIRLYRTWGDCFGYYLVATGFADIMIDPIMSDWDKMALIPIIRGSGGIISDYQGNNPVTGNSTIAAAKGLHSRIIEMLN